MNFPWVFNEKMDCRKRIKGFVTGVRRASQSLDGELDKIPETPVRFFLTPYDYWK
jgi:hypothetical protein